MAECFAGRRVAIEERAMRTRVGLRDEPQLRRLDRGCDRLDRIYSSDCRSVGVGLILVGRGGLVSEVEHAPSQPRKLTLR